MLWSHYGNKHAGMALGFDLANQFQEEIHYAGERSPFPIENGSSVLDEAFMKRVLLTKFENWRYEDEVRAFIGLDHNTVERGLYFKDFDDDIRLREVILGPLCVIPIKAVCSMVDALYDNVEIVKAELAYKYFKVVRGPLPIRVGRAVTKPQPRT